jgi:glutamate dehydrogenase (NAD(P)+)
MQAFLRERLPERTWENRLRREGAGRFMEFGPLDVERLSRLGIEADDLGPKLVACMWDEASPLEVGGFLVVDNLAMGTPSMGGIRMLPEITPSEVHNLARGMTLKNAAADLPYGGGKAGIVANQRLSEQEHTQVMKGFAHLLYRYRDHYLPGPDVGTDDADMKTIAIELGLDCALSKPAELGGNCIDELGAAAGGVVIAIQTLLEEMPRLKTLPQFATLKVPEPAELTVLIQGFGAVGAHAARILRQKIPGAPIVGISDVGGYLYDPEGLPVEQLFATWQGEGSVVRPFFQAHLQRDPAGATGVKFATDPNDLLREPALCFIPAAPVANYLDTEASSLPSITVDRMGRWTLIVEGANTYSPDPGRKLARARMERAVYRQRGVLIATDYLVNSGGVIFAAQERLIKTPSHLRFPEEILGDRDAVEGWLREHAGDLERLAAKRCEAAESYRDEVIRRNMRELIDLLTADPDLLPCEAAERISIRRIASSERDRTAADIMQPVPLIDFQSTIREAAAQLIDGSSPLLAVVSPARELLGVVTEWDITRATSDGIHGDQPVAEVMTSEVVSAAPQEGMLDIVRKLEQHEISAMPVVEGKRVQGVVSSDLLTRRSLLQLLQSPEDR